MNKKTVLACILAALLTASSMTACKPNNADSVTTQQTEESSATQQIQNPQPSVSADDFTVLLEQSLNSETQTSMDFNIRQKHVLSSGSFAESAFFVQLQADFSNDENPCFSYAIRKNPSAADDLLLFYDSGYLYKKDSALQYKYPLSWNEAQKGIPLHPLYALFGENWREIFEGATLSVADDKSMTATAEIALAEHLDTVKNYLKYFGGTHHEQIKADDENLSPVLLSVTLDENGRFLSQSVEITLDTPDQHGGYYPIVYSISVNANAIPENFSVSMPDPNERDSYPESEPEISKINLREFIRRYLISDQIAQEALYTKMSTNAHATYYLNGILFEIPLSNVTEIDLSNPKKPQVSMIDILADVHKTEIYYKDEVYYYALGDEKFSIPYPAEDYLASVAASAQEKAEAGISTFFLSDFMLSHAILTVNPDQSVSALISFDGETQRKNIFHNIQSVFNDDLSDMTGAVISDARVCLILNRFNHLTDYILEVTVSETTESGYSEMQYSIHYQLEFSDQPREIVFPDDLNLENYPLAKQQ